MEFTTVIENIQGVFLGEVTENPDGQRTVCR